LQTISSALALSVGFSVVTRDGPMSDFENWCEINIVISIPIQFSRPNAQQDLLGSWIKNSNFTNFKIS